MEFFPKEHLPTNLSADTYYQPLARNYPAVDAITSDGMLQFTVSASHPVVGVKTLTKLATLFSRKGQIAKLLFVVPHTIFDSFQKQSYQLKSGGSVSEKSVPPVLQYVVKLEVGISTSLPPSKKLCSQ